MAVHRLSRRGAPKMRGKLQARIAEWALVRQTASLGDVVDEQQFLAMMPNVNQKSLRNWRSEGEAFGVEVPEPIFRPDGMIPIWLKAEAEKFARQINAIQNARRK